MSLTNDLLYILLLYAVLDDSHTLSTTTALLLAGGILLAEAFFDNKCENDKHCRHFDDAVILPNQRYGADGYRFNPGMNGFRRDCNGRCDAYRATRPANFYSSNSIPVL